MRFDQREKEWNSHCRHQVREQRVGGQGGRTASQFGRNHRSCRSCRAYQTDHGRLKHLTVYFRHGASYQQPCEQQHDDHLEE